MSCQGHGSVSVIIGGKRRCAWCGHRLPQHVPGRGLVQPVETRHQPPWTWPGELIDRRRAIQRAISLGVVPYERQ